MSLSCPVALLCFLSPPIHNPLHLFLAFGRETLLSLHPGQQARARGLLPANGRLGPHTQDAVVSYCANRSLSPACQLVCTKPGSLWRRRMRSFPRRGTPALLRCSQGSEHVSGEMALGLCIRGFQLLSAQERQPLPLPHRGDRAMGARAGFGWVLSTSGPAYSLPITWGLWHHVFKVGKFGRSERC